MRQSATFNATIRQPIHSAGQLRDRLLPSQQIQALAAWLDARPQLGRNVFDRRQPEIFGFKTAVKHEVDVIEFLWAAMALFDDDLPPPDIAKRYRPQWLDLYSVRDAGGAAGETETKLKRRSAWTSTFVAGLELAKQGDIALNQAEAFVSTSVSSAAEDNPMKELAEAERV